MSAARSSPIAIRAPAKLNLGLEILGKRGDGFHEIRTIMAMLEFSDDLIVTIAPDTGVEGVPGVPGDTNLISRAVDVFRTASAIEVRANISVTKRIPMAAGLGGASANAAATLRALNSLVDEPLSRTNLAGLAAMLGSDVPFFLGSPLAVGSGTGTDLTPLEPVPFDVFLIDPAIAIPNKTTTLYGMLEKRDFSDGSRIERAVFSLKESTVPSSHLLANAFERPLFALRPELGSLRATLEGVESLAVGMSGTGPVQYVVPFQDRIQATEELLRRRLPSRVTIVRTRSRLRGLHVERRSLGRETEQ